MFIPEIFHSIQGEGKLTGGEPMVAQGIQMPQGVDPDPIRGRHETLIDLCKQRGCRYWNCLHIELFGNTQGT